MSIMVHIPFYNVEREIFQNAVRSLIKQSYAGGYKILITTDGCEPDARTVLGFNSNKLLFYNFEKNHGRYFCDAVASMANPFEFYLPSDADDISNYHRLYYLASTQAKTKADFTYTYQKVKTRNGRLLRETYPMMNYKQSYRFMHLAHWSGLYKSEALEAIGGIHPGFRVGYDTLLTNLIKMNGSVACVPRFLYERISREESLTLSSEFGFGSLHRRQAVMELVDLYKRCYGNKRNIKKIITASIDKDIMYEVKMEAEKLKEAMGW